MGYVAIGFVFPEYIFSQHANFLCIYLHVYFLNYFSLHISITLVIEEINTYLGEIKLQR